MCTVYEGGGGACVQCMREGGCMCTVYEGGEGACVQCMREGGCMCTVGVGGGACVQWGWGVHVYSV